MSEVLYSIMRIIARIHNYIMHLNDRFEYNFSDKDMHFLVIGVIGMFMIFVVYPLFKWLAQKEHIMVIAWIYVFTLILVLTFAIEIGQKITNTGNMEFDDIVFGVMGFFAMFAVFAVVRGIYHGFRWIFTHRLVEEEKPATVYEDTAVQRNEEGTKEGMGSAAGAADEANSRLVTPQKDKTENQEDFTAFSRPMNIQQSGEYEFSEEDLKIIEEAARTEEEAGEDSGTVKKRSDSIRTTKVN